MARKLRNTKKKKNLRVGLIGCGRISSAHLSAIASVEGVELAHVCDIDEARLRDTVNMQNCPGSLRYEELPLDDMDVVSIATPNYLHFEMARFFLHNGIHAIIEKPITLSERELTELERLASRRGAYIFPVLQVRFNPAVQALKQAIVSEKLGKLISGNLTVHWNRPQKYFDGDGWRGKKALDGGTLVNQGIHYLDLLIWMLGPVRSVYAVAATLNHDIEVEDHVSAILRFKNGALATVEFNVNTYPRNLECSLFVQGSSGSVKIGGLAANTIDIWEVENTPAPVITGALAPNVYAGGLYQGSCPNHAAVYTYARDTLLGRRVPLTLETGGAKETLRVIEAIYASSKLGREVSLSSALNRRRLSAKIG